MNSVKNQHCKLQERREERGAADGFTWADGPTISTAGSNWMGSGLLLFFFFPFFL